MNLNKANSSAFKRKFILVVEDNKESAESFSTFAAKLEMRSFVCGSMSEYRQAIEKRRSLDYALVDMRLSAQDDKLQGLEIIEEIVKLFPDCNVIGISGEPEPDLDLKVRRAGGLLFVKKPILNENELAVILSTAKRISDIKSGRILPRFDAQSDTRDKFKFDYLNEIQRKYPYGVIVSEEVLHRLDIVLKKDPFHPFLIIGETGSGKEQIAKLVAHKRSELEGDISIVVRNSAELNSSRMESDLFGHVKGAFTGAETNRQGAVAHADKGILFLDEIHTASKGMQEKLLRVLEDGSFYPVGSDEKHYSKFQLITATNVDLNKLVQKGEFKDDFMFRIASGQTIRLPSLKSDKTLIKEAVALFFCKNGVDISEKEFHQLVKICEQKPWHGNFRTLYASLRNFLMFTEPGNYDSKKFFCIEDDLTLEKTSAKNSFENWLIENTITNPVDDPGNKFYLDSIKILKGRGLSRMEIINCLKISTATYHRILDKNSA